MCEKRGWNTQWSCDLCCWERPGDMGTEKELRDCSCQTPPFLCPHHSQLPWKGPGLSGSVDTGGCRLRPQSLTFPTLSGEGPHLPERR